MSRRAFLGTAAGMAAASLLAQKTPASPRPRRLKVGLASYTLRKFSLDQAIEMCRAMDVRSITLKDVHLPMRRRRSRSRPRSPSSPRPGSR
jgi:hypothetical protein